MCMIAVGLIGAGISAAGSIMGGIAAKQQADYNAEVARMNAAASVREGYAQAGATRDQYAEVKGAQTAALAKSGVDINSATSAVLGLETQRREETAAAVDIWRGRSEGVKYQNQADAMKAEGKAAMTAGVIGGVTSLVGGLSGMSGIGQGSPLKLGQASPTQTRMPIRGAQRLIPVGLV